jgi:hypothetical protein
LKVSGGPCPRDTIQLFAAIVLAKAAEVLHALGVEVEVIVSDAWTCDEPTRAGSCPVAARALSGA